MRLRNVLKAVSLILTASTVLGIAGSAGYVAAAGITLSGSSTVQKYGVIDGTWDDASTTLTLKGRANPEDPYKPIEAINVKLTNSSGVTGSLKYSVYVQSKGWQEFKTEGNDAGIANQALRIEALKMELTGALADSYTVEYAVVLEKDGNVQGFVSDGAVAGTVGEPKKIEEIKIRIVPAGTGSDTDVNYRVHRESSGWGSKWAGNGKVAGAAGKAKQIDSIELNLTGNKYKGGITYRSKIQKTGWEKNWASNGMTSGTQGKRIEAVAIKLTGEAADHYDVYYRVCVQSVGWLGWAKNGAETGIKDLSYKLEALQVVLTAKGGTAPVEVEGIKSIDTITEINSKTPLLPGLGLFRMGEGAQVSYSVKTASGWSAIKSDGDVLEVSAPITGLAVGVNIPKYVVGMFVDTPDFGENIFDENESYDTDFSLKIIDAKKKIENLGVETYIPDEYGNNPEDYQIFFRVKTSGCGWMAWAPERVDPDDYSYAIAGTDEVGQSITAIQIVVCRRGQKPDNTFKGVTSENEKAYKSRDEFPAPYLVTDGNKFAKWCKKTFPYNKKNTDSYNNNMFNGYMPCLWCAKNIKYRYGGSSKKGCDCSGFVVYVMRKYFHKRVYHGMYKLSHKIGKKISYSQIKPGDWLCDYSTHHGWVSFYVGKDNYGHDIVLTGYTGGKVVTPTFEFWDIPA